MVSWEELGFGEEIRGVVCPVCGGSLVRYENKKALCIDDGFVKPQKEESLHRRQDESGDLAKLSKEDRQWLTEHSKDLEPEIE